MSECKTCGRTDGHWLGCAEALDLPATKYDWNGGQEPPSLDEAVQAILGCSFDGCSEPRKSADKRTKYCEKHSDPKNRK